MRIGPDGARYWLAGAGEAVARPFNLRWLAPFLCRQSETRWWVLWGASWPLAAAGMWWWHPSTQGALSAVLLLALPGVWGPSVTRPVGVDLPALALSVLAVAAFDRSWWLSLVFILIAASFKESAPVWVALWAWNPLPLIALAAPLIRSLISKPELDPYTAQPNLLAVHDHPVRTAWDAHKGRWRDAWLHVAPWGVCLIALHSPSWPLLAVLLVAHLQLLVATDTVRLVHTAAGPAMAWTAAQQIPPAWTLVAAVGAVFWWRKMEVI